MNTITINDKTYSAPDGCGVAKSSANSSECINNFIHKIFGE